jgi:outer membrane protein OmpA-like peptidoglycan-associated protein
VAVGCVLDRASMSWCRVRAFQVGSRGKHMLVGTGRVRVAHAGQRSAVVRVRLNARGRRLIGRALGGMSLHLSARAQGRGSKVLAAGTATVLYPQQVTTLPTINPFVFDSTRMINAAAYRALRSIAADIRSAKTVTCVGHTDSVGSAAYNRSLGLRRAQTVCDALRRLGVKAGLRAISAGETQPRANNATAEGRLRNRRVELRISY